MTTPHARPIRPFNDAPETQAQADVAYASHGGPASHARTFRRIETRKGPLFEDSTTGRVLTADEIVPPAEPTESLDSLYSLYRPDTTAFVKAAVLLGHTAKQANAFLDAPADGELTEDDDDDGTDARVGRVF